MALRPTKAMALPPFIGSPADLGRLLRELESINEALLQLSLRQGGQAVSMPRVTKAMSQLTELNKLNLLRQTDRKVLRDFLTDVKDRAPVLHISFSVDPSPAFLEKLLTWLRREIHPLTLVTVGLQPTLGVGCVVRSTNKYFDFSLRQNFADKRDLLLNKLLEQEAKT